MGVDLKISHTQHIFVLLVAHIIYLIFFYADYKKKK